MYSIRGLETVFDVMAYTVRAMDKSGLMPGDIEDYIAEAVKDSNFHIIEVSKDRLEMCNELLHDSQSNEDWFEDTWRDHYYSSLWNDSDSIDCHNRWDDDGRYDEIKDECWCDEDDEDIRNYFVGNSKHDYWDDDNVIDDVESIGEKEAYEGFSSCKNHYWDCTDDDCFDDDKRIYGEIMYDPWATEEDDDL